MVKDKLLFEEIVHILKLKKTVSMIDLSSIGWEHGGYMKLAHLIFGI